MSTDRSNESTFTTELNYYYFVINDNNLIMGKIIRTVTVGNRTIKYVGTQVQ